MAAARRRFIKFATSLTVAGGVLYMTASKGIWSDSFKGSMALKDLRTEFSMETGYLTLWNKGAKSIFEALATAPLQLGEMGKTSLMSSKDWISKQLK